MPVTPEFDSSEQSFAPRAAVWTTTALAWLVTGSIVLVPLVCSPDQMYRFRIKEFVTRGEGILGLFLVVCAVALGSRARLRELWRQRPVFLIAWTGVLWTLITTLTSTHRLLSVESLISATCTIAVFFAAWYAAPRIGLLLIDLVVPVAWVTAVLATLQETGIYNPFRVHEFHSLHLTATATIGNPNVVGTYLAFLAVVFTSAVMEAKGARRFWYAFGALGAVSGLLVSQTETAVIGLAAAIVVLALRWSWRRTLLLAGSLAVIVAIAAAMHVPVVRELATLPQRMTTEGMESALSGRVAPARIAFRMAMERPVFGFGPGTYGFHFMPRRTALAEESRPADRGLATNFGEVHNDHLEVAAETGFPGYILFLSFVFVVVRAAHRPTQSDGRARIAHAVALPLAVAFLVMALAQFPLQVAVTAQWLATMAGVIVGWSRA